MDKKLGTIKHGINVSEEYDNLANEVDNRQFLETGEQCNTFRSEFEYIKDFIFDYSVPDSIGYTRA